MISLKCAKKGCRAWAMTNDEFCFWHSPKTAEKRREAGRRGGSRGKVQKKSDVIETIADIKIVLAESLNELRSCGSTDVVKKSRAVAYVCHVLADIIKDSDLERRLRELEETLSESRIA